MVLVAESFTGVSPIKRIIFFLTKLSTGKVVCQHEPALLKKRPDTLITITVPLTEG